MASLTYLDTHVAVWLYVPRLDLLSDEARVILDRDELAVSPMVVLELEHLREIGRLRVGAHEIVRSLEDQLALRVCELGFPAIVRAALQQRWTQDPFDRVIVGHALHAGEALLTRDETIRANCAAAVW